MSRCDRSRRSRTAGEARGHRPPGSTTTCAGERPGGTGREGGGRFCAGGRTVVQLRLLRREYEPFEEEAPHRPGHPSVVEVLVSHCGELGASHPLEQLRAVDRGRPQARLGAEPSLHVLRAPVHERFVGQLRVEGGGGKIKEVRSALPHIRLADEGQMIR